MNLKKELQNSSMILDIKADTKKGVIQEMVGLLVSEGKIKDYKKVLDAILEREDKMSTGMQNGIAIPHARSDVVTEMVVALGFKKGGVDFNAHDGQPSTIFIMIVTPMSNASIHMKFMSAISKAFMVDAIRNKVLEAKTRDDIINAF
jgi:fructose-specific phosphotransferase system IIA component